MRQTHMSREFKTLTQLLGYGFENNGVSLLSQAVFSMCYWKGDLRWKPVLEVSLMHFLGH